MEMPDAQIENGYPDTDQILVIIGDWTVTIWRDEHLDTIVNVHDKGSGTETLMTLGQEGSTQKV